MYIKLSGWAYLPNLNIKQHNENTCHPESKARRIKKKLQEILRSQSPLRMTENTKKLDSSDSVLRMTNK